MSIKKTETLGEIEAGSTEALYAPEPSKADGTVNVNLPDDIQGITSADPPVATLGDYLSNQTSNFSICLTAISLFLIVKTSVVFVIIHI